MWTTTNNTRHSAVQASITRVIKQWLAVGRYGRQKSSTYTMERQFVVLPVLPPLFTFFQTITGCFLKIKQLIDDNTAVIVGVALGIAALEV